METVKHRNLKILYVAHERKLGGATKSLIALLELMITKGHQVCVLVPTLGCPLAKELTARNIDCIPCFFAWWMYPRSWNILLRFAFECLYSVEGLQVKYIYRRLQKLKFSPDIVHTNSSVTDFGARLAKRIGCRHVWHVREYGDADYNLEYMKDKSETWQFMNENSDRILFISNDVYNYFSGFADKRKSIVVYNGIAQKYLVEKKQKNDKTEFLLASNINRSKNHMLVLRAVKMLADKGIHNFHLNIAGAATIVKDSKLYEEELKRFVSDNELAGYVSFLGKVDDMIELRKQTDVEIVPSVREAFGRVTVEAMMAGMPVIASASGANVEIVEDEITGILFESNNAGALSDAMSAYIANPQLSTKHGDNGYTRAKRLFTADKNADEVEMCYLDVCNCL